MFTGIITHSATIASFERKGKGSKGARMHLRTTDPAPFQRGESLSVNGVCLTVLPMDDGSLVADLSDETLIRTTLGSIGNDSVVNIERALAIGDRLGGHLVQGHVDTVGRLVSVVSEGEFAVYRWTFPAVDAALVVARGSIAVDGISLTIVEPALEGATASFAAALIPETLRRTNLGTSRTGQLVNLEFDIVAKYVRTLVAPYLERAGGERLNAER